MAHVIIDSCAACGTCIDGCPVGAVSEGDIYSIDADTYTDRGAYTAARPLGAIEG